jgi:hypothetical protein
MMSTIASVLEDRSRMNTVSGGNWRKVSDRRGEERDGQEIMYSARAKG